MTIDDYENVYKLWLNTPGMGLNNIDDSREGVEAYLARNPGTCFAAKLDGEIVGAILAGHDGRRGYIYHLAVKLSARNQGIGSALVKKALEALKAEGIVKVALVVFSRNEIGNAFWEKLGFTVRDDLNYRNKALKDLKRFDV
jgi:ribosomal protein S18 acetylase RimI-like enzyme